MPRRGIRPRDYRRKCRNGSLARARAHATFLSFDGSSMRDPNSIVCERKKHLVRADRRAWSRSRSSPSRPIEPGNGGNCSPSVHVPSVTTASIGDGLPHGHVTRAIWVAFKRKEVIRNSALLTANCRLLANQLSILYRHWRGYVNFHGKAIMMKLFRIDWNALAWIKSSSLFFFLAIQLSSFSNAIVLCCCFKVWFYSCTRLYWNSCFCRISNIYLFHFKFQKCTLVRPRQILNLRGYRGDRG